MKSKVMVDRPFALHKVLAEKEPIVPPSREGALLRARFRRALNGPAADAQ